MNVLRKIVYGLACLCVGRVMAAVGDGCFVTLPADYTRVEFIQGDGKAYIDLKTKFTNEDSVFAEILIPSIDSSIVFGSRTSSQATDAFGCGLDIDVNRNQAVNIMFQSPTGDAFSNARVTSTSMLVNRNVSVELSAQRRAIFDDEGMPMAESKIPVTASFETPYDMTLFAGRGGLWTENRFNGRIYSFMAFRAGAPLFVLVPCTKDGVAGLYDAVSGTFFVNAAGEGDFVAGPACGTDSVAIVPPQRFDGSTHEPIGQVFAPIDGVMTCLLPGEGFSVAYSDNVGIGTGCATISFADDAGERALTCPFEITPMYEGDRLCTMTGGFQQDYPVQGGLPPDIKDLVVRDVDGRVVASSDYSVEWFGYEKTGKATIAVWLANGQLGWAEQIDIWEVPDVYTPVEYVQGDGIAAIDLGFKLSSSDTVQILAMVMEAGGQHIYGSRTKAGDNDAFIWSFNGADNLCILDYCANGSGRISKPNVYDLFVGKKVLSQNGADLRGFFYMDGSALPGLADNGPASAKFNCGVNCGLFTTLGTVWQAPNFAGRIYDFRVLNNGAVAHALLPCVRGKDQEVGFYDAVTGNFHVNTVGAGAFSAPEGLCISRIPDQVLTMGEATPKPSVSFIRNGASVSLEEGRDYVLSYSHNAGLGTAQVKVSGVGSYAGYDAIGEFLIRQPANPQVFLAGDFSLRGLWPKRGLYLKDYYVVDVNGTPVGPYKITSANDRETGDATVKALVTAGPYAGEIAASIQPIVVVPKGYTPVEYIQGDGTAAIDLGFKLSASDTVQIWAMVMEAGGQHIYGSRTANGRYDAFLWSFNGADDYCILDFCATGSGRLLKQNVYDLFVGKKILAWNGVYLRGFFDMEGNELPGLVDESVGGEFKCGVNCGLFTTLSGVEGGVWNAPNFSGRIYAFAVTREEKPYAQLVPCVNDSTAEVGFWDGIRNIFVGRTTAMGTFTAGKPIRYTKSGLCVILR